MSTKEVSRSDILLAIVAAANGKELSRAHLQKVAFLLSEEFRGKLPSGLLQLLINTTTVRFVIDIYG